MQKITVQSNKPMKNLTNKYVVVSRQRGERIVGQVIGTFRRTYIVRTGSDELIAVFGFQVKKLRSVKYI